MSLYELESMMRSFPKLDAKPNEKPMTQDRINELKSKWAGLSLPDVRLN